MFFRSDDFFQVVIIFFHFSLACHGNGKSGHSAFGRYLDLSACFRGVLTGVVDRCIFIEQLFLHLLTFSSGLLLPHLVFSLDNIINVQFHPDQIHFPFKHCLCLPPFIFREGVAVLIKNNAINLEGAGTVNYNFFQNTLSGHDGEKQRPYLCEERMMGKSPTNQCRRMCETKRAMKMKMGEYY